ncbi:hypothetical protein SAMN04489729_4539 [Amycolatopsis lurida]|nr:hypothetical protein SAMN04489729_4539 [Amycolatopsis lurida]
MTTLNDGNKRALDGVTRTRCTVCKRFAKLLPGEKECAPCQGMLPLDLTGGGRR